MPNGMISRSASWSRPALVMVLYLGLGAAALGWTTLRGQSTLWQLPGRSDPWVFTGIVLGLVFGLAVVFASRLAFFRFEWARALHRDFRALLSPLGAPEIVVLAAASSIGEEMFFRGALIPVLGLVGSSAVFALLAHRAARAAPALDDLVVLRGTGVRRALPLDRRPDRRGGGALHHQLPEPAPRGAVRAALKPPAATPLSAARGRRPSSLRACGPG